VDIDGQAWRNPPAIGCDEFYGGAVTGALNVAIRATYTNVASGFMVTFASTILGHAAVSIWSFSDGTEVTNRASVTHAWASGGDYPVMLQAYNNATTGGVSATITVHVVDHPINYVSSSSVNPVAPYVSWNTAATSIQEAVDVAFGGATVLVTNGIYQTGGRVVYGLLTNRVVINKAVTVRSVNGPATTFIQGYQVSGTTNGDAGIRCVYMTNNTALIGFTLIYGATRDTGDTVLEQRGGGVYCESTDAIISDCVLMSNSAGDLGGGVYKGTLNNCSLSGNWAVNGGGGASQGTLNSCMLSNNAALFNGGGGAEHSILSNCSVIGNSAYYAGGAQFCTVNNSIIRGNRAAFGGGAAGGVLAYCILENNSATYWGGGACGSVLGNCLLIKNSAGSLGGGVDSGVVNNCTISGNSSANVGGGVSQSGPINNCIIYNNSAASGGSNYFGSDLNNCCTMPAPTSGAGNITNAPLFINSPSGDFHLRSNSPCINAGNNAYALSSTDLTGNPRIVGGSVDIGAYEYQTPSSVLSYAWAQQYGLPTDGTGDFADSDGDGMNNWEEWRAKTDPTNPLSVLKMLTLASSNSASGLAVSWQSVGGVNYDLQRSSNLTAQSTFSTIQSNIVGLIGTTGTTDTTATNSGPYFYRVEVQ
jgi:hypothetical protein